MSPASYLELQASTSAAGWRRRIWSGNHALRWHVRFSRRRRLASRLCPRYPPREAQMLKKSILIYDLTQHAV